MNTTAVLNYALHTVTAFSAGFDIKVSEVAPEYLEQLKLKFIEMGVDSSEITGGKTSLELKYAFHTDCANFAGLNETTLSNPFKSIFFFNKGEDTAYANLVVRPDGKFAADEEILKLYENDSLFDFYNRILIEVSKNSRELQLTARRNIALALDRNFQVEIDSRMQAAYYNAIRQMGHDIRVHTESPLKFTTVPSKENKLTFKGEIEIVPGNMLIPREVIYEDRALLTWSNGKLRGANHDLFFETAWKRLTFATTLLEAVEKQRERVKQKSQQRVIAVEKQTDWAAILFKAIANSKTLEAAFVSEFVMNTYGFEGEYPEMLNQFHKKVDTYRKGD